MEVCQVGNGKVHGIFYDTTPKLFGGFRENIKKGKL